jgi:2-polyprenyl-3-methyl-5-hydroxy-6-metoxy-1,4-benzoquinol methylase
VKGSARPFYSEYAWAYDLIIGRPVSRECACVTKFLVQRGVTAGARMLDAGCGTGRYSLELARRGYIVTGLDASTQLIAAARRRAGDTSLPVSFAVGDILALPAAPSYDGILCRGVLNDLLDERSRQEVFFAFARALRPAGALILDVREWHQTVRRKKREPVFETYIDTAHGQLTFRSVTQLDHHWRQLLVAEHHTLRGNDVETSAAYDFIMRCWTQEELHHHLVQAGFQAIAYFGGYDRTITAGLTDRLVCVASLTSAREGSSRHTVVQAAGSRRSCFIALQECNDRGPAIENGYGEQGESGT